MNRSVLPFLFAASAVFSTVVLVNACGGETASTTTTSASGAGGQGGAGSTTTGTGGATSSAASSGSTTSAGSTGGVEGTGGGGPVCSSLGLGCPDCAFQKCNDFYCQCSASQPCLASVLCSLQCGSSGGDETECLQTCWSNNKEGIAKSLLLGMCVESKCKAECPLSLKLSKCEQCNATRCEAAVNDCYALSECSTLVNCARNCQSIDCKTNCTATNPLSPSGKEKLLALIDCAQKQCTEECKNFP